MQVKRYGNSRSRIAGSSIVRTGSSRVLVMLVCLQTEIFSRRRSSLVLVNHMVVSRTWTGGAAVGRMSNDVLAATAAELLLRRALDGSSCCCCWWWWRCCWCSGTAANTSSMSSHDSRITAGTPSGCPRSAESFSSMIRSIICRPNRANNTSSLRCPMYTKKRQTNVPHYPFLLGLFSEPFPILQHSVCCSWQPESPHSRSHRPL